MADAIIPIPDPASTTLTPVYPRPERNPARVYIESLDSATSRATMLAALNQVAGLVHPGADVDSFPWHTLHFEHTVRIRSLLMEADKKQLSRRDAGEDSTGYRPATINKLIAALRGVIKNAWRLGYLDADEYMRASDVKGVKNSRRDEAAGRSLALGETMALLATCNDGTRMGTRDAAILAVGIGAGLRRAEIAGLSVGDYDATKRELTVRHGKGNKERIVALPDGALYAIEDWLDVRGRTPGPLFVRLYKGDTLGTAALASSSIQYILDQHASAAAVSSFSPHDMRRTYISELLDAGADLSVAQQLAGHSSPTTTARYDRRDSRARHEAVKRLHIPYQPKNTKVGKPATPKARKE